ncbi:tail assembly protein [Edwardsiella piscicida]|uniref:Tail assembly protein n=2 Tax=Edwardsiella piscicida TaxID=1263550 RepID=A0AAQ3BYZ8_EDWPI|nr:tail assembly protein [Edwardsiella piscicida]ELM3737225.1 tail assembly protein [Edwardsiella piscicida]MDM3864381.1 tail assembly protein [Edwardsiella piscicida]UJT81595.1 tail assembly protein [Edwardsiella piscicida]UJT84866.1 tail assembly protein [Edwardsiella piscicida]WDU90136.1 tail assembly protein [Edwardsiella piscicida]
MATTHAQPMATYGMATFLFHGDLQRFGRRIQLQVMTAAEGLHALLVQISGLRQHLREGWYQVRIAGHDVASDKVMQRLHEPLPPGAIVHIVPRMEGAAKGGIFQFIAGAVLTTVGLLTSWTGISSALTAAGIGMMLGGVAQMLTPTPRTPASSQGDNGKGNSYFSNLDNAVSQGNVMPIPYGEILTGSRVISQSVSIWDGNGDTDVDLGKAGQTL